MLSRSQSFGIALATLIITPTFGQTTINSSYRMVSATADAADDFSEDIDDTNALGEYTYNAFAEATFPLLWTSSSEAYLESFVGPGMISGSGYANSSDWHPEVLANSGVEFMVEFSIDAPIGFNFDFEFDTWYSEISDLPNQFQFLLYSDSESMVELNSTAKDFFPYDGSIHLDGVLAPGDYTLSLIAKPIVQFFHNSTFFIENSTFDFTLEIPAPSTVAAFAITAGLVGVRRRRSAG